MYLRDAMFLHFELFAYDLCHHGQHYRKHDAVLSCHEQYTIRFRKRYCIQWPLMNIYLIDDLKHNRLFENGQ